LHDAAQQSALSGHLLVNDAAVSLANLIYKCGGNDNHLQLLASRPELFVPLVRAIIPDCKEYRFKPTIIIMSGLLSQIGAHPEVDDENFPISKKPGVPIKAVLANFGQRITTDLVRTLLVPLQLRPATTRELAEFWVQNKPVAGAQIAETADIAALNRPNAGVGVVKRFGAGLDADSFEFLENEADYQWSAKTYFLAIG
jgi:hypothetical protein